MAVGWDILTDAAIDTTHHPLRERLNLFIFLFLRVSCVVLMTELKVWIAVAAVRALRRNPPGILHH